MRFLALGGVVGTALAYLFDPRRGRERRAALRERAARLRRLVRRRSAPVPAQESPDLAPDLQQAAHDAQEREEQKAAGRKRSSAAETKP